MFIFVLPVNQNQKARQYKACKHEQNYNSYPEFFSVFIHNKTPLYYYGFRL